MAYKNVPISAAKEIAKKYNKAQVLLLCWEEETGLTHITTYGINKKHCDMAAAGGQVVAEALGLKPNNIYTETT